jgi:hypothetical protein
MNWRVLVVGLLGALLAGGCGGKGQRLKTYPVKGKVVRADGSPFLGGSIEFRSASGVGASGTISRDDGSFTLVTVDDKGRKYDGTVEGPAQVTVLPAVGHDQKSASGGAPLPIVLPSPVTIKPEKNDAVVITLPL